MTDLSGSHGYGYDDRYQLTAATHPAQQAETFGYDSVGNRTTSHISASYTYNSANQLLEDAEFTYTFDLDGNCVGKVSKIDGTRHEYIFNSENRMTGYRKYDISSTLLTTADYFYDALGRRIAKRVNGALTRYMYHEEDIWLAITPSGIAVHYQHGPGIDEPLVAWASYDGPYTEPLYYFADGLGTIRAAKGQDWAGRDMSASYEFDSFGQVKSSTSTLKSEWPLFTYTAREADSETGQLFLRARYYDPRSGRFVSEDPAGVQGILYPYAGNDPVNYVDPFGLAHEPGGPWHPDDWIKLRCLEADGCPTLQMKISLLSQTIQSHRAWDKKHGINRHADDIQQLINAIENCKAIYDKKCPQVTPPTPPKTCPQECKKSTVLVAVAVAGYIVYKLVELYLCPPLVAVTP
ncbi:MAG: RHS repeat-associated core domain-containing protein [Acidobacteria bacterium]|nr:RHS repeat-associated core domain-containing protein [Acidobacteriota bacterium]